MRLQAEVFAVRADRRPLEDFTLRLICIKASSQNGTVKIDLNEK